MAGDVFVWPMSAEANKGAVDMLRDEIISAHQAQPQRPVPISLVFALLPVTAEDTQPAIARGNFIFNGDRWENRANDPLEVAFNDPVLKEYSITFPAVFAGTIEVVGPRVKLVFEPPIEIEIPRLAELGVDRSKFQQLVSVDTSPEQSLSILKEASGEQRETWIQVRLARNSALAPGAFLEVSGVRLMDFSSGGNPCGGDPNDPNWYVYERNTDHLCFVHYGTVIEGGQLAYTYRFGPATYDACNSWSNTHCQF